MSEAIQKAEAAKVNGNGANGFGANGNGSANGSRAGVTGPSVGHATPPSVGDPAASTDPGAPEA